MTIKPGFELRTICGEHIIVAHGLKNIDFTKIISLNDSAAAIWQAVIDRTFTLDDMTRVLLSEYEIDAESARADAQKLLDQWIRVGFVEE